MKMLFSIVLSITLAFILGTRVESAEIGDLINGKNIQWKSREYRIALVEAIESVLLTFDIGVPNISPEQKEWLTAERSRINLISDDGARASEVGILAGSVAFRIEKAKDGISAQLSNIKCIKRQKILLASEMVCWAILSFNLQDEVVFESIQQLHKEGRIVLSATQGQGSRLIIDSKYLDWGYWPEIFGEGILEYLLIPYLFEKQLNK